MIRVFGQTDKTFNSNGDIVLRPLKAKVTKKDNSDFFLDLETDLSYVDYLVEGNIIVASTPQGEQAFRIGNVQKTKSKLTTKCWHVFYDTENYLVLTANIENKTCAEALHMVNSLCEPLTEFLTVSDVAGTNTLLIEKKSLYEAIKSIVETWGGHLVRDNFTIGIKASIGTDNGITVQYKKNLKDITCTENWDAVVTKLLPVGKDGILLNEWGYRSDIYVESSTQYDIPYCKTVQFEQDIDESDYGSTSAYRQALISDLYAQATAYINQNCVPQINYTLKANLERVTDIGDTVEVIDERLGIHLMTNVIGYVYDVIAERYTEIEFGNFTQSLGDLVSNINTTTQKIVTESINERLDGFNDYIYATGETSGWFYNRYQSGHIELWKTLEIDASTVTWSTLVTGLSVGTITATLPFSVTDAVTVATVDSSGGSAWIASANVTADTLTEKIVTDTTTGTIKVNVIVRGTVTV